ncbi:MAG: hypothetical protein E2O78_05435 [Caldithrix sp.]|nr:MAG: hypothetical protein E2O78_05435 [Caldithrix sp.]
MNKLFYFALALASLGLSSLLTAGDESVKEVFLSATPRSQFRAKLAQTIAKQTGEEQVSFSSSGEKSVAKAVLFSAAIPGTGQLYNGSAWKGAAFLVLEAVAIFAQFHYDSEGGKLENRFEALADGQWNEDAYWDWIAEISDRDRNDDSALREYEKATFSHFLPEKKNQQYYENIGKYNQFVFGWQDFRDDILVGQSFTLTDYKDGSYQGEKLETISPTRNDYTEIRKDSNDNFKRASTFTTITVFNHVLSALDAGITANRNNQKIRATVGMRGLLYRNEVVPALALGISW